MPYSKQILFAEDDPNDIELTMLALGEYNLANEVVSVKNGVEALDYLYSYIDYNPRTRTLSPQELINMADQAAGRRILENRPNQSGELFQKLISD